MEKRGLSLRYKILIALTVIPLIIMSLFLSLAVQIFEEDKVAYVFDSSLAVSKTRAARVKSEMSSLINMTQSVVLSYSSSTKSLAESGTYFFQREPQFEAFQLYAIDPETGSYVRAIHLQKESVKELVQNETKLFSDTLTKARESSIILEHPKAGSSSVLLGLRFGSVEDPKHVVALCLFQATSLLDTFREEGGVLSYLVGEDGASVFGPTSQNAGHQIETREVWGKLRATKGPAGIEEISIGQDQQSYLTSFVTVGLGGLYVISMVDKQKALQAVTILLRKSILFFVALFSFTVILSVLASNRMTSALRHLFVATKKVSEGDFGVRVQVKSTDEIGSLATSFNSMAEEVSRLMKETAEKARMESELETAKTVQETLFPENVAKIGPVEIAGHYQPASECGGDWWYYCENEDQIYLWIGDATGHGAPAALLTSAARAVASVIQGGPPVSPGQALSILNRAIYETSKGRMMMTFFLAAIDKKTGLLRYANASHEAPLLLKPSVELPQRSDYIPLNEVNNPRLGERPDVQFKETSLQLDPGDRIVFYTDGVVDVKNPEAKNWGERRFLKTLSASLHAEPSTVNALTGLVQGIHEFREDTPLDDDVTVILCKFEGAA